MSENKVIKGSIIIIIFTIGSKILGFFRETLIAARFGATYSTDIYTFAIGMVGLLFASIGGSIATTFIPMLTEYVENRSNEERNRFVCNIISIILILVTVLVILGIVFANYIVFFFAPGFKKDPLVFQNAIQITRIMFLSMFFIGLQSVFTGVLQSHKEFTVPASMGIFTNTIYIVYLFFFAKKFGIYGFAIITVFAYFIQFAIHVPKFKKLKYKFKLVIDFKDEGLRRMLKLMIPVIIGASVMQINFIVDRLLATTVGEGSIAVLNFANKLNMLVYGIFVSAISTVIYPSLSAYSAQENTDAYKNALVKAINVVLLIMIPTTVGMVVLRNPIITVVFKRGAFDENAAYYTAVALLFFSPGIVIYGVRDILNKAFYSVKDTKTPMMNAIAGVIINIILNLILVKYMGVGGLALATSVSALVTTMLLIRSLNKKLDDIGMKYMIRESTKIVLASAIMGIVVYVANRICLASLGAAIKGSIISVAISTISGILVYAVCVHLFKVSEYMYALKLVKRKILR